MAKEQHQQAVSAVSIYVKYKLNTLNKSQQQQL